LALGITKYHAIKMHGGVEAKLHTFLTWVLDGSEWSASHLSHFTTGERAPSTHWIGGWVGPRGGVDALMKRKILCPCQELNSSYPSCSLLMILTEPSQLLQITGHIRKYKTLCGAVWSFDTQTCNYSFIIFS
jgi:hypothetical protein